MTSIRRVARENSSLILAVGAGVGVLGTAYLTGKASFQAARILDKEDPAMELKERVLLVWKLYIPAGATAATTIVCVAGVKRIDARRVLAGRAALAVSQAAYESYREQVVAELGDKKDQVFVAKAAEKRVNDNPPTIITGYDGSVLCCDLFSGRYFHSTMEILSKAVNQINAELLKQDYATMDDFYYILGLEYTTASGRSGWKSPKLLELEFSSILYQGKPVLAFAYNYVDTL